MRDTQLVMYEEDYRRIVGVVQRLVRLRVKKGGAELAKIFEEIQKKAEHEQAQGSTPFAEITDDDIDNLFSE